MYAYRFKNLNIRHDGIDILVGGQALYKIEDYEEDGKQAAFYSALIYDAVDSKGYITSQEVWDGISPTAVDTLNQDSHLCRILGGKI